MRNVLNVWMAAGRHQKILLLRHGAVQAPSTEKRFIGQTDLPLSAAGRRQARYWRDCLAKVPLSRIVCSDLSRCLETARIIAANRCITVSPCSGLREIHLGQWEGMSFRQVQQRWPDVFKARGSALSRFRPPAGESFFDLQQRVLPLFEQARDQQPNNLLIVSHAGVNRIILCHLLGMPLENLFRIAQSYGAMNLMDRQADGFQIHALNLLPDTPDDLADISS